MSVIYGSLPAQPATNTFFDNNEAIGLVNSADTPWERVGVTIVYGPCTRPTTHTVAGACADDEVFDYATADGPGSADFTPFRVRKVMTCNPAQWNNDPKAFFNLVESNFRNGVHANIANAFWEGNTSVDGGWDGLISPVPATTTPVSLPVALGYLIEQMASTGGGSGGTIHMTPSMANHAVKRQLVYRRGQRLYTVVGDFLVIADGGYTGNGHSSARSGTREWIFATGPVFYKIGELEFAAGFDITKYIDRKANKLVVPVEATAIFFFDPCSLFSVPVDLTKETD